MGRKQNLFNHQKQAWVISNFIKLSDIYFGADYTDMCRC